MGTFRTNTEIQDEIKRQREHARTAEIVAEAKLRTPLANEQARLLGIVSDIWSDFAYARELNYFFTKVVALPGYAEIQLVISQTIEKVVGGRFRYRTETVDVSIRFTLRPAWGGGLILDQPENWRLIVDIPQDATDLALAFHKALGLPVTLMSGDNVLYRASAEENEEVLVFQARI